ncbi:ABC transporter substrate-binding protein [bacterium]|nr:ABC transporter substrate-binding protein [bacterium]
MAACSSSGPETTSESGSLVSAVASTERVELGFLNELVGSKEVGRTFLLAAFNAANDQIYTGHDGYGGGDTVHQKFLTALAGGVVPDLYHNEANYIPAYAEMDALEDLGPYLDSSTRISKDDINSHPLDLCTYNGKIYGLPIYEDTMLLYYNKTLMAEAGLDPESPPTNWEELREQAEKIVKYDSDGNLEVAGCLLDSWSIRKCFLAALYGWGGQLLSDDGTKATFNSQEGKDALQTLVDLILVYKLGIVGWGLEFEDTPDEPFTAGKQGFMFDVPAAGKRIMRNNPGFTNWGTVGLPAGPVSAAAVSRPPALMIPKGSKNKAEAWRVIEYWFDTKVMLRWALDISRAPGTKSASEDPELLRDPIIASLVETLKDTVDSPKTKYWAEMEDTLGAALELAIGGEKSVSDALDDAAVTLDNMLSN